MPPPKSVITYARYSPTGRKEVDSIDRQRALMAAWCEAFERPIVGQYDDARASGKNDARPGLQAALKHVCQCKGVLLVHKLPRLARNLRDALRICDRLQECKADLAIVSWNVDTSTHTGRMLFQIMAAVAEWQREEISDLTSEAVRWKQANGQRVGPVANLPYGYMPDPGDPRMMVPDPYEQETIVRISEFRAAGLSYQKVGDALEAAEYKARQGVSWKKKKGFIKRIHDQQSGESTT